MLRSTFQEYVDSKRCCYIPGKVIDEIFSILRRIKEDENPQVEIRQELDDLSTMAKEHFVKKIVPTLGPDINPFQEMLDRFKKQQDDGYKKVVDDFKKKLGEVEKGYKKKLGEVEKGYEKKLGEVEKQVAGYKKKLGEVEKQVAGYKKKLGEVEKGYEREVGGLKKKQVEMEVTGKGSRKRSREMESPDVLESKKATEGAGSEHLRHVLRRKLNCAATAA